MPKGKPLTKELRERIYDLYTMGVPQADIAEQFDIHSNTVSRVVSTQRKLREGKRVEKVSEVVVAGDKRNGRLLSVGTNKYEGTCLVGGKMKRRTFTAINARNAETQWIKWCATVHDEHDFMSMVERKPRHDADEAPTATSKAVTAANVPYEKPMVIDMSDRPAPKCVATGILSTNPMPSSEPAATGELEGSTPDDAGASKLSMSNAGISLVSSPSVDFSEPAYLIWAKSPEPRCYGLYLTMDAALAEVDRLNEVARFLGSGGAFEVEEVAWRG